MSLTGHLRNAESPIRAYLDGISPSLGGRAVGGAVDDLLGLVGLAQSRTVVPPPPGVDVARSGTAVDFRARIALGGFDPFESAAALGVEGLSLYVDEVENGYHRARILREAFDLAARLLEASSDEADFDRAAILLAHCEQVHRAGRAVLSGSVGEACDRVDDGQGFADSIDIASLDDLRSLMASNTAQISEWRGRFASGERFEPNPVFAGSMLVGGADADWLIGDTLIDCKAYATLTVTKLRDFLRQLLGYVMLDLDDALGIRSVGVWLPRQRVTRTWSLARLLGGDPAELLPALREGFMKAANRNQLVVRVPATQRRKDQVLADNKHTPRRMLMDLAQSYDVDIRFRVGRNGMAPERTVRELAQDRYAKAREGVARNENAPTDVLETLSHDSSVTVRRAVAENPRRPKDSAQALERTPISFHVAETRPPIEALNSDNAAFVLTGERAPARIVQDRDDSAMDSRWFAKFVDLTRGRAFLWGYGSGIPLPEASILWAWELGRSIDAPSWLKHGLPERVKVDLMREGRPAWVRRAVADDLSVADPAVRDRLLADADPEIRWSALCRTIEAPDDALGPLLGALAVSRTKRQRFREEGDEKPSWARSRASAEYDTETLKLIANHPSTPLLVLRELMSAKSADILVALVANTSLPAVDLVSLLPRLRSIRSVEPREWLAASHTIPAVAAGILVDDRDPHVRAVLASNEAIPVEILDRLAEDKELVVRLAVIVNRSAPDGLAVSIAEPLLLTSADEQLLEVLRAVDRRSNLELREGLLDDGLDQLSKSRVRSPDMRLIAGGDPRTGRRTLERLAKSADETVRSAVASNTRTPVETMAVLVSDSVPEVRAAAARNEALDIALVVMLAHDDEADVRASAASSLRLDAGLLGELLLDDDRSVRSAAFRNPATGAEDKSRAEEVWERRYQESGPGRADLEEMAVSTRAKDRLQVAFDRRTPPDILLFLAGDRRSARVRRAVAANPNTPAAILTTLADDKDDEVRQALAFNGATPPELLVDLAGRSVDLALLVAMNPDAPPEILDVLTQDLDPLVSYVATESRQSRALTRGSRVAGELGHS